MMLKLFLQNIWNKYLRYIYSIFTCINDVKDMPVYEKIYSIDDIKNIQQSLFKNFSYQKDFIDEIHTPAQCYKDYFYNNFNDDCDGFHSALYHILSKNNIEQWLVTQIPKYMYGHTYIIFKFNSKYGIIDYTNVTYGITNRKDLITIIKLYKYDSDYLAHYIWKWDYEKKKYVNCKESEL